MACLGPRYVLTQSTSNFLDDRSDVISGFNRLHSLSTTKLVVKNHSTRICAAATVVSDRPVSNLISSSIDADLVLADRIVNDDNEFYDSTIESPNYVPDKLEEWVRGSVTEIVKNIRQAPLLLQIYANGEVKTEKAMKAKSWPNVISERSSSPDGIILVEELGENRDDESSREFKENGGTRAFGVLIQGKIKGRDHCKSACYLLKTSSVNGGGLGFACSHYCLMKVKSFRETASSQLNGCWLV
ncbi:hypothetical protein L6452_12341 [Arctium lappa]|uniref:Uncharacterized protein n=1 Tax=Arctium lappa TaxID=4217 RepID=A0ACB9DRK6_ARCLA|nr:hypothetical protein L6452_12341 [Arctium lappa]